MCVHAHCTSSVSTQLLSFSTQSCSLAAIVALPIATCMHLNSCSHVHGNAYSVLRPLQSAGQTPPKHQHVSALILYAFLVAMQQHKQKYCEPMLSLQLCA